MVTFELGDTVVTRGVFEAMREDAVFGRAVECALARHAAGDWGDCDPEDAERNNWAAPREERIISVYRIDRRTVWVITEADRTATTVLFPCEY